MYSNVEKKVLRKLQKFALDYFEQHDKTSSYCTYAIKEIIGELGYEKKFKVCASGFPDHYENEWLYDIVWFEENDNKNITSIELVLESEMTYGLPAIKMDFEKLLLANARHRIMICCQGHLLLEDLQKYFEEAVKSYELLRPGDRFLVLIWDDRNSGEFIPQLIIK